MAGSQFLEDYPLLIPAREGEGNMSFGTFYDCVTARQISGPLDISNLDSNTIAKLPIKSLKYDLKHLKDTTEKTQSLNISLELVLKLLGIPLNFGSVQYDTKYKSTVENDHFQIFYAREDSVERLLPTQEVLDRIKDAHASSPNATHIVMEVFCGVQLQADILIKTVNSNKLVNKSASGLGSLLIGPISAGIEAALKAVLNSPGAGAEPVIDVDSNIENLFPDPNPGVNAVFDRIKTLHTVQGQALRFLAVPIKHIILEDKEGTVPMIAPFLLELLKEKMTILMDYVDLVPVGEDPIPSTHFSKQIALLDHRLHVILSDAQNPLTMNVLKCQSDWNDKAKVLYTTGKSYTDNLTSGNVKEQDIIDFLDRFRNEFVFEDLKKDVERYADEARKELYAVQANDVDEYTQAEFSASKTNARRWISSKLARKEGPVLVVELQTLLEESADPAPPSIFLQMYSLRSPLLEILVRFPNSSDKFALTLTHGTTSKVYESFEDISRVLEILSVGFGTSVGSATAARFYQALAASQGTPLALPLQSADKILEFFNFLGNVEAEYKNVSVFGTFMTFKEYLVNQEEKASQALTIALITRPIATLPLALKAFKRLYQTHKNANDKAFVVADVDLHPENEEGPLLLLFDKNGLVAQCLSWLDFLLLEELLNEIKDTPANWKDALSRLRGATSKFYPNRSKSSHEVRNLFEFSYFKKPSLVLHPLPVEKVLEGKIREASELCVAFLDTLNQNQTMVTALIKVLLSAEPALGITLERDLKWSVSESRFTNPRVFNPDPNTRRMLRSTFHGFLSTLSEDFKKVLGLLETLEFAVQAEMLGNKEPFQYVEGLKTSLLPDLERIDAAVIQRIRADLGSNPISLAGAKKALKAVREELLLHVNLRNTSSLAELSKAQVLQTILSLIPQTVDPDPAPAQEQDKRRAAVDTTQVPVQIELIRKAIEAIPWEGGIVPARILQLLDSGLLLPIVGELNTYLYPQWHRMLNQKFLFLDSTTDYSAIMNIIRDIEGEGNPLGVETLYEKHFIWSNPIFALLVSKTIEDKGRSKEVFDYVASWEEEYCYIPAYIPTAIVRKLKIDNLTVEKGGRGKVGAGRRRTKV